MHTRSVIVRSLIAAVFVATSLLTATSVRATTNGSRVHAIKYGGTVTVSWGPSGSWTQNFNPYTTSGVTNGVNGLIYEPLIIYNMVKGGKIIKWLATGWKFGKGSRSLTFFLRKGVKWTDGKPFTAADLVEMWRLHLKYKTFDPCGTCSEVVSHVVARGKYTVTYTFNQPDSSQLRYLGGQYVIPAHIFSKVGDPTKFTNPNPVGTGPFTLGNFSPQVFTLVKNKHYWQKGRPYVSAMRFPAYSSNDSDQLALINGEIDWGGVFIPNAAQTYASKSPYNHFWYPGSGSPVCLWMNDAEAPFNNVHVRRAISLAIDRQQISKVAEYGYEPPATAFTPGSQVKKWGLASSASVFPASANIAAAKAELAKASGVDVSQPMKLYVVDGWSDWVTSVQLIASQLKTIGMNLTVVPLQFGAYLSNLQTGKFDMAISWSGGPFVVNMMHDAFFSQSIGNGGPNWDHWSNPALDSLILKYGRVTNLKAQIVLAKRMQQIVAENVPIMPIMYGADWYEYNTKHFVGWPSAGHPYIDPAPWLTPQNEVVALTIHRR